MTMPKIQLHWQILIALAAAVIAGLLTTPESRLLGVTVVSIYDFAGTLFLNALKMIIVPLIVASIITGMAGVGGTRGLGRLGGKTMAYYLTTSLMAILVGLMLVNLFNPGIINGQPAKDVLGLSDELAKQASAAVGDRGVKDLASVFLSFVPTNVIGAAADGQMLGLIFFSLLYGFFLKRITEAYAEAQFNFWQGLFEIMMKITEWVMRFAPIGVFALVAKVMTTTGVKVFEPLLVFFLTVLLALLIHFLVVLPLLLRFVGGVRQPWRHYQAMAPALLTAFSTASSSATLPLTMDCVEKRAGVSNRTSSFVLPLGATINMDGTALYECVVALFIAQAYGLELTFTTQFTVVVIALLTSIGVAGIPAASLVAISIILTALGLPIEALGLILVVDRVLDMCRTAVNIFSDSCGAVIIARSEGENAVLTKPVSEQA